MDKETSERLDRIEQHLRLLKDSDIDKTTMLLNIENALTGSAFNGNKMLQIKIKTQLDLLFQQYDRHKKLNDKLVLHSEHWADISKSISASFTTTADLNASSFGGNLYN
jgi:hypothetical protein